MANATTCPTCRCDWFVLEALDDQDNFFAVEEVETTNGVEGTTDGGEGPSDDSGDGDYSGSDSDDEPLLPSIQSIKCREKAADFIHELYNEFCNSSDEVAEYEIQACVTRVLRKQGFRGSIPITEGLWRKIRGTMRNMWQEASEPTAYDVEVEDNLVRRMQRLFHWQFNRDQAQF